MYNGWRTSVNIFQLLSADSGLDLGLDFDWAILTHQSAWI